ncbi:LRR_TYP [Nesidiocoris tenuis]|nr:LRR_TYP [Nesidiocoris tenuis]
MLLKLFLVISLFEYSTNGLENVTNILYETPCPFNTLCSCVSNHSTQGVPIYKSLQVFNKVHCIEVPFTKLPAIPGSNVTELTIAGSGLEVLGDESLSELNLRSINLANNRLLVIEPNAFQHSRNTLEALDISYNNLLTIPEEAINNLNRLKMLSVERNKISSLLSVDWGSLTSILESLYLGGNHLFTLPLKPGYSLMEFRSLVNLKLDGNYLKSLPENSVPFTVASLSVSNNHLDEFPYSLVAILSDLKKLNLADNHIEVLSPLSKAKIKELLTLDLSNNVIKSISDFLGKTIKIQELNLSHNKIVSVAAKAFNGMSTQRLNLSYNRISTMHERALNGLTYSLEHLDLSSNSLTRFPKALFPMKRLKIMSIRNNNLFTIPDSAFKNSSNTLTNLDLSMNNFQHFPKHTMYSLRRLSALNFGYNHITDTGFGFSRWAQNLKVLNLESNQLRALHSNAFKHANQLIGLRLGYNKFSSLHERAFANLDNLALLDLGFALRNMSLPDGLFAPLKKIRDIHLDNNDLKEIHEKTFSSCKYLRVANLQFNKIETVSSNLFRPSSHKELEEIRLAFNKISIIDSLTFASLQKLNFVDISFNTIHTLQPESFKNLPEKLTVFLSHNFLLNVHNRTFVHLPNLVELDLHNNELKEINWHMFHNVSNPSHPMTLNLSRNRLDNSWYDLKQSASLDYKLPDVHIASIDLSHNEYKEVPFMTLNALNESLKIVNLGYNHIKSLHDRAFLTMGKVEIVNMEHNIISELNESSFRGLRNVQILDLSHNHISRIFTEQFASMERLRVLDLSYNHISTLPGDCFKRTKIERLLLKSNAFVNVPIQSLLPIGHTLGVLDLSYNKIENMDADQFTTSPLLTDLNLCYNSLTTLRDNVFRNLNSLIWLQICGNKIGPNLQTFHHNMSLQHLNLADTGLTKMPFIAQENLVSLNLSGNNITELKQNFLFGVPKLKHLDLSRNNLTMWTNAGWINARFLTELDISSNPIKILTRENFDGLGNLLSLNLQHLNKLERFDADSLVGCSQIVDLKVQTWPNIEKYRFRLPAVLATLKHLRKLSVHVVERKLTDQIVDAFSKKISVLEITGDALQEMGPDALRGLEPSNELLLRITGTNLTTLPQHFLYKINPHRLTVDLQKNSFSELPPATFYINDDSAMGKSGTHKYRGGIWVQGNPLECGCQAFWLGRWMRRYYKEVLRADVKVPAYGREVLEEMYRSECIDSRTGTRGKLLTFEMVDCYTGMATTALLSRTLFLLLLTWTFFQIFV